MTAQAWRFQNCSNTAWAMAPPICGSVPVPNSSMRISVRSLAWRIIRFMLSRWEE